MHPMRVNIMLATLPVVVVVVGIGTVVDVVVPAELVVVYVFVDVLGRPV